MTMRKKSVASQRLAPVAKGALWGGVLLALGACASTPPKPVHGGGYKIGTPYKIAGVWYHPKEDWTYDETGIASWYGDKFHGRQTANGETFDMYALSAAHPTLPMPTRVKVTNLDNGRSLVLRLNDRGPFKKGRILDVSKAAAKKLGFYRQGTARVRVQMLGRDDLGDRAGKQASLTGSECSATARAATTADAPRLVMAGRIVLPVPGGGQGARFAGLMQTTAAEEPVATPVPVVDGRQSAVPTIDAVRRGVGLQVGGSSGQPSDPGPQVTPASAVQEPPQQPAAARPAGLVLSDFGTIPPGQLDLDPLIMAVPTGPLAPTVFAPDPVTPAGEEIQPGGTGVADAMTGETAIPEPLDISNQIERDPVDLPAPGFAEPGTLRTAPGAMAAPDPLDLSGTQAAAPVLDPTPTVDAHGTGPVAAPADWRAPDPSPVAWPAPHPAPRDVAVPGLQEAPDGFMVSQPVREPEPAALEMAALDLAAEPDPVRLEPAAPMLTDPVPPSSDAQADPLALIDPAQDIDPVDDARAVDDTDPLAAIETAPQPAPLNEPDPDPVLPPVSWSDPDPMPEPALEPIIETRAAPANEPMTIERAPVADPVPLDDPVPQIEAPEITPEPDPAGDPVPMVTAALDPGPGPVTSSPDIYVQVGAYRLERNATEIVREINAGPVGPADFKISSEIDGIRPLFRVRMGPFVSRQEARDVRQRLVSLGYIDAQVVTAP